MTTQISVSRRSILVLRLMLSGIFLIASFGPLMNVEQTVKRIDGASMKGFAYLFGDPGEYSFSTVPGTEYIFQ